MGVEESIGGVEGPREHNRLGTDLPEVGGMVGIAFHPHDFASLNLHQETTAHPAIGALGPSPLWHGSSPHNSALFQKRDEVVTQLVVIEVVEHLYTGPRSGEGDRQDLSNGGSWATGHHDDAVGQEQGLIDIVSDHQHSLAIFLP